MNHEGRFSGNHVVGRRGEVTIEAAVDLHTGATVRMYRFRGRTRGPIDRLEHPNLPGILAVLPGDAPDETRLVTALPTGYAPLGRPDAAPAPPSPPLDPSEVYGLASALAALHGAGIVHGDLGPHRVWRGEHGDVILEGFGVPWRHADGRTPEPHDDARALGEALRVAAPELPPAMAEVLMRAAEGRRDVAQDGHALAAALRAAHAPPATDVRPTPTTRHDTPPRGTLVKDLPPGGVYHEGEGRSALKPGRYDPDAHAERTPTRRRTVRIALGVAGLIVVATSALALFGLPSLDDEATPASSAESYVLDVRVAPAGAPPMEIVVQEAPAGSDLTTGTRLGRAPRRVVLDRAGRWTLAGVFGERRSDAVRVDVPTARTVTLFLEPAGDTPGRVP